MPRRPQEIELKVEYLPSMPPEQVYAWRRGMEMIVDLLQALAIQEGMIAPRAANEPGMVDAIPVEVLFPAEEMCDA